MSEGECPCIYFKPASERPSGPSNNAIGAVMLEFCFTYSL